MFYKQLKVLRYTEGVSQEDMAQIQGITTSSYNRKENGKQPFLLNEALKISNIFDKSIEEIFPYDMIENA